MRTRLTLSSASVALLLAAVLLPLSAGAATNGVLTGHLSVTGFDATKFTVYANGEDGFGSSPVAADGSYTIPDLPPGTYAVALDSSYTVGEQTDVGSLAVPSGGTATKNVVLTKVSGKVTDRTTGAGIGKVVVSVDPADDNSPYTSTTVQTSSTGAYAAPVVVSSRSRIIGFFPPGQKWIGRWLGATENPSGATKFKVAAATTKTISVSLPRSATLKGTLKLPGNATPADWTVFLYPGALSGDRDKYELEPTKSGKFTITGLHPGTYRIGFGRASGFARAPGTFYRNVKETAPGKATEVALASGASRTLATAQAPKVADGGKITGSVYLVKSGKKVGRAHLEVVAVPTNKNLSTRSVITRAGGKYTISGLSPGTYKLYVWNTGYAEPSSERCVQKKIGTVKVTAGKATAVAAAKFTATYRSYC